jgi:hypothetical protein
VWLIGGNVASIPSRISNFSRISASLVARTCCTDSADVEMLSGHEHPLQTGASMSFSLPQAEQMGRPIENLAVRPKFPSVRLTWHHGQCREVALARR